MGHTDICEVLRSKICKSLNGRLPGTLIVGNMLIAVSRKESQIYNFIYPITWKRFRIFDLSSHQREQNKKI